MAEAWSARGVDQEEVAESREPGGYGGVALQIVDSVVNARTRAMILNTANRSAMAPLKLFPGKIFQNAPLPGPWTTKSQGHKLLLRLVRAIWATRR